MGYTHYWTPKPISAKAWRVVMTDFAKLFRVASKQGIKLGNAWGSLNTLPENAPLSIAFNGLGDAGCESFWIAPDERDWQFCKTGRMPYDAAVVAALLYLSAHHGYEVTTDGDAADWKAGLDLARKAWPRECITAYVNDKGEVRVTMHSQAA